MGRHRPAHKETLRLTESEEDQMHQGTWEERHIYQLEIMDRLFKISAGTIKHKHTCNSGSRGGVAVC